MIAAEPVMVVGGAGFVGSHLVDRLLAQGSSVDVVDDLSSGVLGNLAGARALAADVSVKIHNLDASSSGFVDLVLMRRPAVVYVTAALPPGPPRGHADTASIELVLSVLRAAVQAGVGKVVVTLPALGLYGDVSARDLPVKEGHVVDPLDVRGVLARGIVDLLALFRREQALEFTAIALANVYGPRQRRDAGVVATFAAAIADGVPALIHGDGRQTRDFLYVDDAVDAIARAGDKGSGLVVNVGTGQQTSIRDLWQLMAGKVAAEPEHGPRRATDVGRFCVSPTRARLHLGWSPWTDLASGLRSLS